MRQVSFQMGIVVSLFLLFGTLGCGKPTTQKSEGSLDITLKLEAELPKTGENALLLKVKSKDGKAVTNATFSIKAHMPAHGHGSTKKPKVENLKDGNYKATLISFHMPGEWEIIVEAEAGKEKGKKILKVKVQ